MITNAQVDMMLLSAFMVKRGRVKDRAWEVYTDNDEKARLVDEANENGLTMPELGKFVLAYLEKEAKP